MTINLKGVQVFIATPGGLDEERRIFQELLQRHHTDSAGTTGVTFVARGHEQAFAGVGRPQEVINAQVRESDYLIVVFWDRWGQATSADSKYTSGTEEEFEVGLECLRDPEAPMRDILVLFRKADDRQINDPGDQFKLVQAFRTRLERERILLYRQYSTPNEFKDELERQLDRWELAWSGGAIPAKAEVGSVGTLPNGEPGEGDLANTDKLERAKLLAKTGRRTEAQQLYAQLTTAGYDRDAYTEYARYLRKNGQYGASEKVSTDQLRQAQNVGDILGQLNSLANLGVLKRLAGQPGAAVKHFASALDLLAVAMSEQGETEELLGEQAFFLDNLSLTLRKMPNGVPRALEYTKQALAVRLNLDDSRGRAQTLRTIGVLETQLGNLDAATKALDESISIHEEVKYDRGQAQALASLAEVLELEGRLDQAEARLEEALAINTTEGNVQGQSMNLSQLSRVRVRLGKTSEARENADACLALNYGEGSKEGLAAGLHAMGRVLIAEDSPLEAVEYLARAAEQFQELNQSFGIAATAIDSATAWLNAEEPDPAEFELERASNILSDTPHFGIESELESVRNRLSGARQPRR